MRYNPFSGMMDLAKAMADPRLVEESRKDIFREQFNGIIVDTVCPADTKRWETGVKRDAHWIIAQQYETRDLAKIGHDEWVRKLKENPKLEIKDADVWNINSFFGGDGS